MPYGVASILLLALLICQSATAADLSYDAGVDAWRKKDYPEAAKQWSRAVLEGDADAMNNLAYLYFNGLGMNPRVSDAIRLWRLASMSGQSEAQWHLGDAYENGKGVEKDILKAYAWYRCGQESARRKKAADKSGTEAVIERDVTRAIEKLVIAMSPDDLHRAGVLADGYISRYATAEPF